MYVCNVTMYEANITNDFFLLVLDKRQHTFYLGAISKSSLNKYKNQKNPNIKLYLDINFTFILIYNIFN